MDLVIVVECKPEVKYHQSKGQYVLQNGKQIILRVREKTFTPHPNYYVIGAYFNPKKLELDDNILLIPSEEVVKNAGIVKEEGYNIVSPLNEDSNSKWSNYIIKKSDLANILIEKFETMNQYIR